MTRHAEVQAWSENSDDKPRQNNKRRQEYQREEDPVSDRFIRFLCPGAVDDEAALLHAPPYILDIRRHQCQAARDFLRDVVSRHATSGCNIDEVVVLGKPHREIVRMATERHADVIVMGVRGRGSVDLTLFGSTTNQVVRRARCPVITLRA